MKPECISTNFAGHEDRISAPALKSDIVIVC